MYAIFYFIVMETLFYKSECYNKVRDLSANNLDADELQNNVKNIMNPIKKWADILPSHNIEVQFDIEQTRYHPSGPVGLMKSHNQVRQDKPVYLYRARASSSGRPDFRPTKNSANIPHSYRPSKGVNYNDLPLQGIRRSNSRSNSTSMETPLTNTDFDKEIVYMKDMKKALEDLEKKILKHCNKQDSTNVLPPSSKSRMDNATLMNILNTFKLHGPLQTSVSKSSDEDLNWLKIKLPV